MLSTVAQRLASTAARPAASTLCRRAFTASAARANLIDKMSENDGRIPEEIATGDELREMKIAFAPSGGLLPPADHGTLEKPIQVPSHLEERVVGFEDAASHAVYWFNLKAGEIAWVSSIDKYFKLEKVPETTEV